jgi:hypothetical protein
MELRYAGFDQTQNKRSYKFDAGLPDRTTGHYVVSVEISLFLKHRVNMQEGPSLCARKLSADLEANVEGIHELTDQDLLTYAAGRAAKEAQKAEMRRSKPHRRTTPPPPPFRRQL